MDPITALGLLGSLCSLIEASNSLRKAIKSLKEAEKEVLELFNDVLIFEEALKGFDRVLRGGGAIHKISDKVINIALQEAYATIQNLETQLGRISKHDVPAMRRIKWVQSKSTLQRLHGRLKEQSAMLNTFIALANVFVASFPTRLRFDSFIPIGKHFWLYAASIRSFSNFP